MNDEILNDPGKAIAESIAKHLEGTPGAEVRINPNVQAAIPPGIAHNLVEFLKRVQCTGMEAIAWVEALQYVQQFLPQQPGVPFNGLPGKSA
jgi:hypothetical protein